MNVKSFLKACTNRTTLITVLFPWRRYLFLDCGANNGSSVRKFRKVYDPLSRFYIHSFEPNPRFHSVFANFEKHSLIDAAVDVVDGKRLFYLDRDDGDGSTFFKNKLTGENGGFGVLDVECPCEVRTVDLSRWMVENVKKGDYVVLKLDVEGAEYDILEKFITLGTIDLIDELFIEWHWNKVGIDESRHKELVRNLEIRGLRSSDWDAIGF